MRVKDLPVSSEALLAILRFIETEETIPENARIVDARIERFYDEGEEFILHLVLADNSFDDVPKEGDMPVIQATISRENIEILKMVMEEAVKAKDHAEFVEYQKRLRKKGGDGI